MKQEIKQKNKNVNLFIFKFDFVFYEQTNERANKGNVAKYLSKFEKRKYF
jgi:hypothetical protein